MFKFTLVTPQKKLMTDVDIEEVIVPAARGELNILRGHAPLMTTLKAGTLRVRLKGETELKHFAISWGYCEVSPMGVSVLADTAERPEEISKDRAEAQMKIAHERMTLAGLGPDDYVNINKKIEKEAARLSVVQTKVPQ